MTYQPPSIIPQLAGPPTIISTPAATTFPTSQTLIINSDDQTGGAPAKMFVGGLPQSVTQDSLREYFGRFGRISEAFVLMDEASGRSRGFGFVTFENSGSLQRVLNSRPHYLDGKSVDCKHAVLKGQNGTNRQEAPSAAVQQTSNATNILSGLGGAPSTAAVNVGSWSRNFKPGNTSGSGGTTNVPSSASASSASASSGTVDSTRGDSAAAAEHNDDDELFLTGGGKSYLALSGDKWLEDCAEADERKIFVGGLPDVTPAEFASFFEHFGPVSDAMVMFDRKRRRQRGFGFITFATSEGVLNALQFNRHPVKGKLAEVKKAHPLVLQKARAPAKKEREAAQQQLDKRSSPPNATAAASTNCGKRKSSASPPWTRNTESNWTSGKKARNDADEAVLTDPFAPTTAAAMSGVTAMGVAPHVGGDHFEMAYQSRFPAAPWHQDTVKRRFGYEDEQQHPSTVGVMNTEVWPDQQRKYMGEYPVPFYGAGDMMPPPSQQHFAAYAAAAAAAAYHPQYAPTNDPYMAAAMMGGKYCYGDESTSVYGQGVYEPPFLSKR